MIRNEYGSSYPFTFLSRRRRETAVMCAIGMLIFFFIMIGAHYYGEAQMKRDKASLEEVKPILVSNCRTEYDVKAVLPEEIRLTAFEYYYQDSVALVGLESRYHSLRGYIKYGVEWRSEAPVQLVGWDSVLPGSITGWAAGIMIILLGIIAVLQFVLAWVARRWRRRYS